MEAAEGVKAQGLDALDRDETVRNDPRNKNSNLDMGNGYQETLYEMFANYKELLNA